MNIKALLTAIVAAFTALGGTNIKIDNNSVKVRGDYGEAQIKIIYNRLPHLSFPISFE